MSPTSTLHSKDIIKSDQDKCSYRFITLEKNNLQVLLIHDPSTDKVELLKRYLIGIGSFGRQRRFDG